ncbi:hypothetical protein YC2023_065734 [Brassica napus]
MGESMGAGLFGLGVVVRISLADSGTAVARRSSILWDSSSGFDGLGFTGECGGYVSLSRLAWIAPLGSYQFSGARCRTQLTMMWVVTSSIGSGEVISGWRLVVRSARLSVMELVGREAVLPLVSSRITFAFVGELSIVKLRFSDVVPFLGFKPTGSSGFLGRDVVSGKNDESYFLLNGVLTEIFSGVSGWRHLPWDLSSRFLITRSISKSIREKTLLALMPFVQKLTLSLDGDWRDNLMQHAIAN